MLWAVVAGSSQSKFLVLRGGTCSPWFWEALIPGREAAQGQTLCPWGVVPSRSRRARGGLQEAHALLPPKLRSDPHLDGPGAERVDPRAQLGASRRPASCPLCSHLSQK